MHKRQQRQLAVSLRFLKRDGVLRELSHYRIPVDGAYPFYFLIRDSILQYGLENEFEKL
jgi:hypothetical protein